MIELINVSSRGQIVIPERVREHLGIMKGSRLVLLEKDGELILRKEKDLAKHFEESIRKEDMGWLALAEQSLKLVWDNKKDEEVWQKYL
ncbi:AbrB/MazE/SpoVT family DNA-binding domain-containing protein [archaeon]|nr:AbrB/MazE/SpoVT family DNA-binding domain-containing protein [archaeon]